MENKDLVRIQNLRNSYLEKIKAIESQANSNPGDMFGLETHEKNNNDSDDYGYLFNQLYGSDPDSWKESKLTVRPGLQVPGSGGGSGGSSGGSSGGQVVGRNKISNDITTMTGVTAADIERNVAGRYIGKGDVFIKAGAKYGVNPAVIAAIAMAENGGNSKLLTEKNNVGSITKVGGGNMSYSSLDEGIMELGAYLERRYVKKGLVTIEDIQKVYCPIGASNDPNGTNSHWLPNVTNYMNKISPGSVITSVPVSNSSSVSTEDYKKILSTININPDNYLRTGKIPIPTCGIAEYSLTMQKLIKDKGGVYNNDYFAGLLDGKGKEMFTHSCAADNLRLRKDVVYYLHALHGIVAPKLGVSKINISSGYRNPAANARAKGAKNSMHLGAIAVDITMTSYARALILADAAYGMGFGAIQIGKQNNYFVHLDVGPKRTYKYDGVPMYISPDNHG